MRNSLRKCRKCGKEAVCEDDLANFVKHKQCKYGRDNQCLKCVGKRTDAHRRKNNEYYAKWQRDNREKVSDSQFSSNIKSKYGITREQYDDLLGSQNGVCAICKNSETSGKRLAVDHCHVTLAVRGLLCSRCNTAIGLFKDNKEAMKKAIAYLTADEVRLA